MDTFNFQGFTPKTNNQRKRRMDLVGSNIRKYIPRVSFVIVSHELII